MGKKVFLLFLLMLTGSIVSAQTNSKNNPFILFTGLVLTSDSLQPIPYVAVRSSRRGLIGYSDENGYFDVVVKRGDTIEFQQMEKVSTSHVVPDTLKASRYNVVKLMTQDTIHLAAIFIRALPPNHYFITSLLQKTYQMMPWKGPEKT